MKKDYEKPLASVMSFRLTENLAIDAELGTSEVDDDWWNKQSLDYSNNAYQTHP